MPEIIKNRVIRPSTRKKTSINYRVDIKNINSSDILVINIRHESKPFSRTYRFYGEDVLVKKSLGFKVKEVENSIQIQWVSTQPYE